MFPQGRDLLHEGRCSEVRAVVDQIVSIMTVPLVQGTLRYAWKTGQIGGVDNKPSDQTAKNSAEGSTFAAAVLPLVHACDADAAKIVSDNMKFGAAVYDKTTGAFVSGMKPDTAAVKAALESTYTCLGITCAHVGGLLSSDGVTPEAGMEAVAQLWPETRDIAPAILQQVANDALYEGYLDRQQADIAAYRKDETLALPEDLDYAAIGGLSNEMQEKLQTTRPATLGAAGRIPGVTPAALTALLRHVRRIAA